jgi:hypothetical protein
LNDLRLKQHSDIACVSEYDLVTIPIESYWIRRIPWGGWSNVLSDPVDIQGIGMASESMINLSHHVDSVLPPPSLNTVSKANALLQESEMTPQSINELWLSKQTMIGIIYFGIRKGSTYITQSLY